MAARMGKPQDKNYIVERQDGRMDPHVAEMLRDLTSEHEQIIERVKAIRKELKNLYLPTDHLDEILAELQGQLDRLQGAADAPSCSACRAQTLDKLRGTLRVFHQAHSNFQPSLPREQVVRGRVLDDADRPPPPGYAEAIKRYYEKLSLGEGAAAVMRAQLGCSILPLFVLPSASCVARTSGNRRLRRRAKCRIARNGGRTRHPADRGHARRREPPW